MAIPFVVSGGGLGLGFWGFGVLREGKGKGVYKNE